MSFPRPKPSRHNKGPFRSGKAMVEIWKRSELKKLMRAHGLHYSKPFGQNFLTDRNTLEKITDAANLGPDDHVVEIGAGVGTLTVFLAQAAGHVTAVEIDGRLIPALQEATEGLGNIEIVNEDFLKFERHTRHKLVGNLPYYITTPIIAGLFEPKADGRRPEPPVLSVLMVQKEVAERLLSPPGKKTYGAISVMVQYYAEAELLFGVSSEVFVPKPEVDSAVIRLKPRDISSDDPAVATRMFRLVRAGFDMRRKTLRNSLARAGFSEEALLAALRQADIDPVRRAETLSPRDFYRVASYLKVVSC